METKKVKRNRKPRPPNLAAGFMVECLGEVETQATQAERRARAVARWEPWLAAYRRGGWREAAACTGIDDGEVSVWLGRYPEFREAFADARDDTAVRLERIADEIAEGSAAGTPAQVTMLQFRLRGLRPETYRERSSVSLDQRLSVGGSGDGSRARLLLAEWGGSAEGAGGAGSG